MIYSEKNSIKQILKPFNPDNCCYQMSLVINMAFGLLTPCWGVILLLSLRFV